MSRRLGLEDCELDQEIDEWGFLRDHQVYCPVSWCSANKLSTDRCGDADGPYEGIHVARIEEVKRSSVRDTKAIRALQKMGMGDPELVLGLGKMIQRAVDSGLLKGRRGRRKLF